jgi:trans-2,3-dihydro-3-hydroxyanthranilate isomerase
MTKRELYIVDVFAEKRYAGNQLAVIRHADGLSSEEMLTIAQEMNYAESTFILSDAVKDGGYDVRIFTMASEVPFAGHPTLGTAYIINHEIAPAPQKEIILNLKVGQITVTFKDDGVLWMRQKPPQFGGTFDVETVAEALQISDDDIDTRFPVQAVSTGFPFIIAPLKTLEAVKRAQMDLSTFDAMTAAADDPLHAKGILIFAPETYYAENDLNVRVFVPHNGVPEDPATGSANGCLTGYLAKYQYFGSNQVDCRVEQGYEINRPSLLMLRGNATTNDIEVNVGGRVVMVARGELV